MASLLFYKNVVPLNKDLHANLKLKASSNASYALNTTVIPIVASEFVEISKHMPIAFLRLEDGGLLPVALVGFPNQKNVFLDANQNWVTSYVPAFVRRYPFIFAETGPDQLTLCLDMDYSGLNETEGQALFETVAGNVEPSQFVNNALQMVSEYQRQHILTTGFAKKLDALGVLVESTAKANLPNGEAVELSGFLVVDLDKLRQISDETIKELFLTGELELIYAHLHSLGNILELLRLNQTLTESKDTTGVSDASDAADNKQIASPKKNTVLGKKMPRKN